MAISIAQVALRITQFVFLIITTALIGNVIADAFAGNPGYINFAIFVCVWTWLSLIYGILAAFMEAMAIPILIGILDILTVFFTFVAGVVLAAKLHVHSCSDTKYVTSNPATNGSHDPSKRCRELQAATAFFWFMFALFTASAVLDFMGGRAVAAPRGGIRRSTGPAMRQV